MYNLWNTTNHVIIASGSNLPSLLNVITRLVNKGFGTIEDYAVYIHGEGPLPWIDYTYGKGNN